MSNETSMIRKVPGSNQRYPYIPLSRSLERAQELYKVADAHMVPISVAAKAWGYSVKSSGLGMTLAALKSFNLLEDLSQKGARQIKLTHTALKIIRDPRDISPERDALIKVIALEPPIHSEILNKYKGLPPSNDAFEAYLVLDKEMRKEAAADFMKEFFATMSFANVVSSSEGQDADAFSVQLDEYNAPLVATVPQIHSGQISQTSSSVASTPISVVTTGQWKEITRLCEGEALLMLPENLSKESYEDLEYWIKGVLRRVRRQAGISEGFDPSFALT